MKSIVGFIVIVGLISCGDSDTTERSIPSYTLEKPKEQPEIYLSIPEGIPKAMALVYKDYQELLTEEKWISFLTSVKGFCDGEVTKASLNSRLKLWYPELHDADIRVPPYSRTEEDRKQAWIFWQTVRRDVPVDELVIKPAPDSVLSKANKDEFQAPKEWYDMHLRGKIYDCVEGYPK